LAGIQALKETEITTAQLLAQRSDFFQRYRWETCLEPLQQLSKVT
jgi:hypothetical protein